MAAGVQFWVGPPPRKVIGEYLRGHRGSARDEVAVTSFARSRPPSSVVHALIACAAAIQHESTSRSNACFPSAKR